jgi:hypothetical protein
MKNSRFRQTPNNFKNSEAIRKQFNLDFIVATNRSAIVATIELVLDGLTMEEAVKLFSTAFNQICALKEVDKLVLERFRIAFQAKKDYGALLVII